MTYFVNWKPLVRDTLADIWLATPDRALVGLEFIEDFLKSVPPRLPAGPFEFFIGKHLPDAPIEFLVRLIGKEQSNSVPLLVADNDRLTGGSESRLQLLVDLHGCHFILRFTAPCRTTSGSTTKTPGESLD
jgi:hypothetical protein